MGLFDWLPCCGPRQKDKDAESVSAAATDDSDRVAWLGGHGKVG
jgi:hypothetical protein